MRGAGIAIGLTCVMLGLESRVGQAQGLDISVGGGIGVTGSARASGRGYHGAVSFPVASLPLPWPEPGPWDERPRPRPRPTAQLRAEGFIQGGTITGSPFACEVVEQFYCLGRRDENRIAGSAVFVRIAWPWAGRMRFYLDPIGAGVYGRRTRSTETQGPTALCLRDGMVVGCPDNPPWATFEYTTSRLSVSANTGFGLVVRTGAIRLFVEFRAHRLFESGESIASAVPLTLGLTF
jgi:hypothetical protein